MSMQTHLLAACIIAVAAFAIGQLVAGLGVVFALAASTAWVVYATKRERQSS